MLLSRAADGGGLQKIDERMKTETAHEYLSRRISADESYGDLLRYPRYFEIETVNACNARCPMCTIDDWQRNTPTMKDDLFRRIADDITAHSDEVKRVSLYRDGEPLLDKKLPDRVAIMKDGGIKEVSISTNVSLLDEERSKSLLEAGLDVIVMSIDSLDKDVFENIRVRLNHEEVMENAERFISLRDKINPATKIWMRMIRQETNIDEWPEYHAFWDERMGPQDRIYHHNLFNWGGQLNEFKPIDRSFEPNLPCVALWSLMVIFGNGEVPLCNIDYNNKYPTGSVLENSIEDLWRSKVMNERRQAHLEGQKDCISLCENCNVWDEPETEQTFISGDYAEKVSLSA